MGIFRLGSFPCRSSTTRSYYLVIILLDFALDLIEDLDFFKTVSLKFKTYIYLDLMATNSALTMLLRDYQAFQRQS